MQKIVWNTQNPNDIKSILGILSNERRFKTCFVRIVQSIIMKRLVYCFKLDNDEFNFKISIKIQALCDKGF